MRVVSLQDVLRLLIGAQFLLLGRTAPMCFLFIVGLTPRVSHALASEKFRVLSTGCRKSHGNPILSEGQKPGTL